MAVALNKMAGAFLLLFIIVQVGAHMKPVSSTSDSSSDEETVHKNTLQSHNPDPMRREWQYEGLPIELPGRRQMTSENSALTTAPYPPLDIRFRRIYNPDERATVEDYPFMAALLVNKQLWCGAAIIDRNQVLTAAHCLQLQYNNRFFREYVKMLTVRIGSSNATSGGEVYRVTEINFHPNYKPETLEFNVAVLRLNKNVSLGKNEANIEKIQYSRDLHVPVDNTVVFVGWGSVLGAGGTGGQVLLQKVKLPIYDLADCQDVYGKDIVTRSNFCAGYISVNKNVCNHDAGGPAILDGQLVGILSFSSKRCDLPDQPAVFTTVGAIVPWLETLERTRPQKRNRSPI